jgi:uncharacterized protein (TIGR02246 family)
MLRLFFSAFCIALFGLSYGCTKEITPGDRVEDEREVRELEREGSTAIEEKDLDKWIALYADDAALYYESKPTIRGKDAIRETWEADFVRADLSMSTEPRTVEISRSGDLAWAHGVFKVAIRDKTGKSVTDQWEYALVYKKQADGRWKIMADSANSPLHSRIFHWIPESRSPYAPLAPLIGLACFASIVWFLFGMPVVVLVSAWRCCRNGRLSAGFLVSTIMLLAFFVTVSLLWKYISAQEWNLSLSQAFQAAGDTARYGNPVEDTSEDVLVGLLVLSTFSAAVAGIIAGAMRWLWIRYGQKPYFSH